MTDDKNYIIRENFLRFVPTASTTGDCLAKLIVDNLEQCDLDVSHLVGQGYDGASSMSGKFNGVQAIIRNDYASHALHIHCVAHAHNLAISATSKVPPIRDCLGTIEAIYVFFNTPKRIPILEKTIGDSEITTRTKTLKRLNLTRWVSKYGAVNDFDELFLFVYRTLEELRSEEKDAKMLKNSMDFEFVISLQSIKKVYQLSLPLSREFQKIDLDLVQAIDLAKDLRDELMKIRSESTEFSKIYEVATKIAQSLEIEVNHKRIVGRQKHRANPQVESTEDFFRVTVFNTFLDFYITDLEERFTNHENVLKGFMALFKHESSEIEKLAEGFIKTVKFYEPFLIAGPSEVFSELKMWRRYLNTKGSLKPLNSLDALDNCPSENFPNINMLLKILATLPVSTSTPERTFSCLKRMKTIQRNRIKEDRLNGLAALAMHRDIGITANEVIDELFKKPRRLDFLL